MSKRKEEELKRLRIEGGVDPENQNRRLSDEEKKRLLAARDAKRAQKPRGS